MSKILFPNRFFLISPFSKVPSGNIFCPPGSAFCPVVQISIVNILTYFFGVKRRKYFYDGTYIQKFFGIN